MCEKKRIGFSLIELLVVMAIIALLMGVLIPALGAARSQVRAVVCKSNLHQLALANTGYAIENDGFYVLAAEDMWLSVSGMRGYGGYCRWHGVRIIANEPFGPLKGPLVKYLAGGKIKECPAKLNFAKGFEKGCGGYGYNMVYVGSRSWCGEIVTIGGQKKAFGSSTNIVEIRHPSATLMFADTAFYNSNKQLIEYSFAEPPFYIFNGEPETSGKIFGFPFPSIHFRHNCRANVGWVDGHITSEAMNDFNIVFYDGINSSDVMLGWFGPLDNSLFDLK
ncbi:MAG: hypothetical protein CVV39_08920 [Planctomycetes bacterium HGW-Planctomycetes-1]|nr:MAG: hypothetical protein CVV39_08920 [Planctomycetes bacterium HGW-Planctomycetes-1]